jgi:hypothetical protein
MVRVRFLQKLEAPSEPGVQFSRDKCDRTHLAEIFLVGGRGNQRIAMSSDLIRDR